MEAAKNEARKMEFYQQVAGNPKSRIPISNLVENLNKQGVLEMFISSDNVEELNALLGAKLPEFKPIVTKSTFTDSFADMFLEKAISKIYENKLYHLPDYEIIHEIYNFICTTWAVTKFEEIWKHSCLIAKVGYQPYVELYKKHACITKKDIDYLDKVFRTAFPMGIQYEMPTKQWISDNQELFNAINLCIYFDGSYVSSVFANIQQRSKKDISTNTMLDTDTMAISCVEKQLMARFIAECNKPLEEVDAKEVYCYIKKLKGENKLYLMAMYYIYAHKSFEKLTNTD